MANYEIGKFEGGKTVYYFAKINRGKSHIIFYRNERGLHEVELESTKDVRFDINEKRGKLPTESFLEQVCSN